MTTGTDILNGKESILGYVLRNRKFLIVAGIGVIIALGTWKGKINKRSKK